VGELFDIPLFEERDVYGGAIFMSAPGPLHPLGTMLQEVLNETGRTLEKEGCSKGLGEWVVRIVKGIPEGPHVAAQFVEKLVATLPGFTDKATYKDKEVLILKKAQLLAADLYRHMRVRLHANTLTPLKHMAQCSLHYYNHAGEGTAVQLRGHPRRYRVC
jgi:hypothetical protein